MILAHKKLHDEIAASHPSLMSGKVWCGRCRRSRIVDPTECLRSRGAAASPVSINEPEADEQ